MRAGWKRESLLLPDTAARYSDNGAFRRQAVSVMRVCIAPVTTPKRRESEAARYAVARCCSWRPNRTLITFDTPGSCMVTP